MGVSPPPFVDWLRSSRISFDNGAMRVVEFDGASRFLDDAAAFLEQDVPRNQLILGIASMVRDQPDVYAAYGAWLVLGPKGPIAAASCTPPYNYVLADSDDLGAIEVLARAISASGVMAPGVIGNRPTIEVFVDRWKAITGEESTVSMGQGVFRLSEVADIAEGPGEMRSASADDRELLIEWFSAFHTEANPDGPTERLVENVDQRLDPNRPQGVDLWVDQGNVVSMSGYSAPVSNSMRIGPVYTPPELRGRGYATGLVKRQSKHFLDTGRDMCLLYTDLANPTSNAIYMRIGYEKVTESMVYRFDR